MKRISIQKIIILITLQLLIASVFLSLSCRDRELKKSKIAVENEAENLQVPNFCELVKNPKKYDGKTVRLKAKITFGLEGAWTSDANCGIDKAAFVESQDTNVWTFIEKLRRENGGKFLLNDIELDVIGKFKNKEFDKGGLITPFRLEITRILP